MGTQETWEALRKWEVVRYLVYYLTENLVAPELIKGKDVVDFSCGIGDLSLYMAESGARSVTSTQPEEVDTPKVFESVKTIAFKPGVPAKDIHRAIEPNSVDIFVARMVFQFPTEEKDYIDVDGMLRQVHDVLRPGGYLIVCSHEYTEIEDESANWNLSLEEYVKAIQKNCSEKELQRRRDLLELVQTIGIPPREGVHAQTGFGLKALMFVDSLTTHGFEIERCAEIEDFTFPRGLQAALSGDIQPYAELSKKVFEIKKKYILSAEYKDKYQRPQILQTILQEINELHPFATFPIFSVWARKQGK